VFELININLKALDWLSMEDKRCVCNNLNPLSVKSAF